VLPAYVIVQLFPAQFQALARDAGLPTAFMRDALVTPQRLKRKQGLAAAADSLAGALQLTVPRPVLALVEELAIIARGVYLGMLFTPVVLLAPLAFYMDLGRARWMELICWTLERAGPAFIK
jgi:hypothetical protein